MKLAVSSMISDIDGFSYNSLGVSPVELMGRSGDAVASAVREAVPAGSTVAVLAGGGNNGGDGYAAALRLLPDYSVTVYDIFHLGQRSEEGKHYLEAYRAAGGVIKDFVADDKTLGEIKASSAAVDAIFGTGFHNSGISEDVKKLAIALREAVGLHKIAVDVPLGIDADNGSITDFAVSAETTVALCFIKPGIVSYPARSYVGRIVYDDLGLPRERITSRFDFRYHLVTDLFADEHLPRRAKNTNKGSFGRLLLITGSERFRGAAALSAEAALRGGVGYVTYAGTEAMCAGLGQRFPEIIYKKTSDIDSMTESEREELTELSSSQDATLIGCGSGFGDGLRALVLSLLAAPGGALVLDADAINCLADGDRAAGLAAIASSPRKVILTPHPLEFSRIFGIDVAEVQLHRIEYAERFAAENHCILMLKGASTLTTDGNTVYINSTGSSSLAKAGSGDVLAGFVAALVAQTEDKLLACALAAFYHGQAGDRLAKKFSSYGVIPSDLPREIASCMAESEARDVREGEMWIHRRVFP